MHTVFGAMVELEPDSILGRQAEDIATTKEQGNFRVSRKWLSMQMQFVKNVSVGARACGMPPKRLSALALSRTHFAAELWKWRYHPFP